MKIHINWDGKQRNGIIFNDKYDGCMFKGQHLKPILSFNYTDMSYSEVFKNQNYIVNNGVKRELSDDEKTEIISVAVSWTQELGQEGNPTEEQIINSKILKIINESIEVNVMTDLIVELGGKPKDRHLKAKKEKINELVGSEVDIAILQLETRIDNKIKYGV